MELVINGNSHYIPAKWAEVPLSSYMKFMATYKEEDSDHDKQVKLVSAFTGVPVVTLGKAKKSIIDAAAERLAGLIEEQGNTDLVIELEIEGVDYAFNPNLSELKLKEFVDLDNHLADEWANMHKVMSILYRPVKSRKGDKYIIEEYDFVSANKRATLFKDKMSMNIVTGAAAFFLTIAADYINTMRAYSAQANRQQRRSLLKVMKKRLKNAMAGMGSYII